jgi:hypothetical protein
MQTPVVMSLENMFYCNRGKQVTMRTKCDSDTHTKDIIQASTENVTSDGSRDQTRILFCHQVHEMPTRCPRSKLHVLIGLS